MEYCNIFIAEYQYNQYNNNIIVPSAESIKLNVYEWTKVEEIAGYLQVAADASQMMDGGKYPTSSSVLPCIAKVIESVDPATKILFPARTVDGHVTVQQLCVVVQQC